METLSTEMGIESIIQSADMIHAGTYEEGGYDLKSDFSSDSVFNIDRYGEPPEGNDLPIKDMENLELDSDDDLFLDNEPSKIGLSLLPNQSMNFAYRKGGQFNLMIVGQVGVSKTTFINTLFNSELLEKSQDFGDSTIEYKKFELVEDKYPLQLTIIESSGFGKDIDNDGAWIPIQNYIDEQFRLYLLQNHQPDRSQRIDKRVHCCLYFLPNSSKAVKPLDIETMKCLSTRVNLVPVIGRSDCLSKDELADYKVSIQKLLKIHNIKTCEFMNDEELVERIQLQIPYSLIGSNHLATNSSGQVVRCRKYDWGLIEVENDTHCEFNAIRNLVIRENMLDFILSTETHYEEFRLNLLTKVTEDKKLKNTRFADEVETATDGFKQLSMYQKFMKEFKPRNNEGIYSYKEEKLKRGLNEIVIEQEQNFKQWKKSLVVEQERLNQDLEQTHQRMIELHETVASLEEGFGLVNPSLHRVEFNETYRLEKGDLGVVNW